MLSDILTHVGNFLGRVKLAIAIAALVGAIFSGTIFYVCALLLVLEALLPHIRGLVNDVAKFAIKG